VHAAGPVAFLYLPASHAVHVPPLGPVYPALHAQSPLASLAAFSCTQMHTRKFTQADTHASENLCLCVCLCICEYMYVCLYHTYVYLCMYMYVCKCVCVCVLCVHACPGVFMCLHVPCVNHIDMRAGTRARAFTHTHTHTHTNTSAYVCV
jgi:hypothetical protein